MDLGQYYTNDQLSEVFHSWRVDHPDLIEIREIGLSHEKRPISLLVITNSKTGADTDKPAVWIDANIHATEITGTTIALGIAQALLDGYQTDPEITRLLDTSVYYILPRLNPDGAALCLSNNPKFIRSGCAPTPTRIAKKASITRTLTAMVACWRCDWPIKMEIGKNIRNFLSY